MKFRVFLKYILFMLVIIVGVMIFIYPTVASIWNEYVSSQLTTQYKKVITENANNINYEAEWEKANIYNDKLPKDKSFITEDLYEKKDPEYENLLNINKDGVMGYIEIPSISQKLPIYHYTSENELKRGVGHLYGSSLPTGSIGNCILTGHSAIADNPLFTRLDEVKEEDYILLHVIDKDLAFKVSNIKIVKPEAVERFVIDSDKKIITLITCYPFAINSHRLIVTAELTDYPIKERLEVSTAQVVLKSTSWNKLLVGALIIFVFTIISIVKGRNEIKENISTGSNSDGDSNSSISAD